MGANVGLWVAMEVVRVLVADTGGQAAQADPTTDTQAAVAADRTEPTASPGGAAPLARPGDGLRGSEPNGRPPRVAVLDVSIQAEALEPAIGESLSAVIAAEVALRGGPRYQVISRNEVRSLLRQQIEAQQFGCSSPQCFGDTAKILEADYLVSSSLAQLDREWVLSLQLTDTVSQTVLARQSVAFLGDKADLVELVRPYVARLIDGTQAETYRGSLEIRSDPEDAEVVLEGENLGVGPLAPVRDLPIGKHRLLLTRPGYLPFERDVLVHPSETTLLQASLVDKSTLTPWWQKWWFWSIAGGAVLAGGVATAAILLSADSATSGSIAFDEPLTPIAAGVQQ